MPTPVVSTVSPAVRQQEMDFGEACKAVVEGRKITRVSWGNDDCIFLYAGFLHIRKADGLHRLVVSDGDLLATDWVVVRDN